MTRWKVREVHADCPLTVVSWDDVPDGYVDLTFRVPDKGLGFGAGMTAHLAIREKVQE